jgi:hypothetical protein
MIYAPQQQRRYSTLQQQQRSISGVNQPLMSLYGTFTKNINCCSGRGRGVISRLVNNNCNNIAWMQRCYYSGQHQYQQRHQQQHQQQSTFSYHHPAAVMMTAAAAIVGAASTSTLLTSPATAATTSSGSGETDCNHQVSTAAARTTTKAITEGRLNVTNDNLHHDNFFLTGTNSAEAAGGVMNGIINSSSRYCYCEEGATLNHHGPFVAASTGTVKSRHQDGDNDGDVITATSPISTSSNNSTNNKDDDEEEDNLPIYTMSTVSQYNGQPSQSNPNKRIWMTYGGYVYDVTEFIVNHPGGSEKIMMGAGGAIEPYWYCEYVFVVWFVCLLARAALFIRLISLFLYVY